MPELTDAAVKRYKPGKTRREIPDSKATGLYLVVQPTGAKSWALRFRRPDGRSAKLTLGPLDTSAEPADEPVVGGPLTLGMARELAAKVHRERKRGVDVVAEEKAKKERKRREYAERFTNTFGAAVRDFCHASKPDRQHRLRYWRYKARVLGLAYPVNGGAPEIIKGSLADTWADKPLAEITDVDVHTIVRDAAIMAFRAWTDTTRTSRKPVAVRRYVVFYDEENDKRLGFFTNNFELPALTIAQLYKCRWQVELFFKWIKQHLRIKAFFGTNENAVKTQIWIAISVYVLVAIVKKRLGVAASLYTILQFSASRFSRKHRWINWQILRMVVG